MHVDKGKLTWGLLVSVVLITSYHLSHCCRKWMYTLSRTLKWERNIEDDDNCKKGDDSRCIYVCISLQVFGSLVLINEVHSTDMVLPFL